MYKQKETFCKMYQETKKMRACFKIIDALKCGVCFVIRNEQCDYLKSGQKDDRVPDRVQFQPKLQTCYAGTLT